MNRFTRFRVPPSQFAVCCLLVLSALWVTTAQADDSHGGDQKNPLKEQSKAALLKTGGDSKVNAEAAALAFAGEHHPELKTLVESLKSANPGEYKKAIHDLARMQERLAKLQGTKASNRYDHELSLWKLDSRIRLTAARSAMKETEELRAELKTLVEQRQALAIQQLKDDRERTAARLAKIDTEIQSVDANQAQSVDAEVDRLLRSVKSKHADVTKNLKADKVKKPGQGEGKPKGEVKPGESKPKGEAQPGESQPKGKFKPSEGKPKGEAQPDEGNPKSKGEKKPSEPQPEPKAP